VTHSLNFGTIGIYLEFGVCDLFEELLWRILVAIQITSVNKLLHMKYTSSELQHLANEMRIDIIRMLHKAASGHPGGSLSAIDLMTCIFWNYIGRTKENALDPDRHRFVLSKGHGVPALYAIFKKLGMITDEEMMTLRTVNSRIQVTRIAVLCLMLRPRQVRWVREFHCTRHGNGCASR